MVSYSQELQVGWQTTLSLMVNHQNDASTENFSDLSDEDHTDL